MILSKFSSVSLAARLKTISLQLIALSLFSCNKTANINANKSFVNLTHLAYNLKPILMTLNGKYLFHDSLSFGNTSGIPGNPYDTTVSQVSQMNILQALDSSIIISGNAAFRQGAQYSVFFYDTLSATAAAVGLIILQDNPIIRTDTFTNYRYMNFSPGDTLWGLKLINNRKDIPYYADTVIIGASLFVGYNNNPGAYPFETIRSGNYSVFAYRDSANPAPDRSNFDSLGNFQIDSLVNYYIYLQGFYGDTSSLSPNKFQLTLKKLN
jgi:hypothetical protein